MSHSGKQNKHHAASNIDIKTSQSLPYKGNINSLSSNSQPMTQSQNQFAGKHYIVDFWGDNFFQDIDVIETALIDAAKVAGAILLHIHLHKFSDGGGITGVALLAESHISVHTWPENDYAAFDIFMCGNAQPEKAIALLQDVFQPHKVEIKEILRGKIE